MNPSAPVKHHPRFGGAPFMATMGPVNRGIASMYNWFETSYEPGFILLSKIFGNAIPRIAICRTPSERMDVTFNELTQGATLFASLPLLAPFANAVQSRFYGRSDITGKELKLYNATAIRNARKVGGVQQVRKLKILKLGKAFGVSAITAAALWAITYLRNYRTIKKTGFADYKSVVGLGGKREPTAEERREADRAAKKNLKIIATLMAAGTGIALGGMGVAAYMARNVGKVFKRGGRFTIKYMDQKLNNLFKHWALVGKNSNQINSVFKSTKQTLWVWGVPSYIGWILACRDKYEVVEQLSKFATFVGGYIGVPKLTGWVRGKLDQMKVFNRKELLPTLAKAAKEGKYDMTRLYNQLIHKMAKTDAESARGLIKLWNGTNIGILALNLFVIGALPIFFNIAFSAWRYQREEDEKLAKLSTYKFQHPGGRLYRKGFESWGRPQPASVM